MSSSCAPLSCIRTLCLFLRLFTLVRVGPSLCLDKMLFLIIEDHCENLSATDSKTFCQEESLIYKVNSLITALHYVKHWAGTNMSRAKCWLTLTIYTYI